ncbi:MarR family winged helix-turn-helix transcriptional regulator [Actinoplanes sp. NBRC 103695]|uniref:MarR family winged helix-turn-helix transcriptional regulator n=1 Tax=Actinoplanes sp. NBRC 103695 TaxID=3032202 RepID=UPI0024A20BF0|nr:MarR family winged helix-turn-helix transcriptional regulator [Actinoplanes sp. NBRC 103695]GLY95206.1 MarR family transcriptional regulator [Actinoplanes sp. NBRC 103695]
MIPWNTSRLAALFDDVVRVEIELWDAVDARLRSETGLTVGRFQVMRVIGSGEGLRVQDIAATMAVTVGGISKLVDRIEAAGHCVRTPHPADRRSSLIEMTPAGRQVLDAAEASAGEELNRLLDGALPPGGLDEFAAALATLRDVIIERNPR